MVTFNSNHKPCRLSKLFTMAFLLFIASLLSNAQATYALNLKAPSELKDAVMQERIENGKKAIMNYAKKLKATLKEGMKKGPENAVQSCKTYISSDSSPKVFRTSLRTRNQKNNPKGVFSGVLQKLQKNKIKELQVFSDQKQTYLVKPIYVSPLCVTCHGASIAPTIRKTIRQFYPNDKAIGYSVGDFRGIFFTKI